MIDLTRRCPTCGQRADICFDHGTEWKKPLGQRNLHWMTEHEFRASVDEFTEDDPPPYGHVVPSAAVVAEDWQRRRGGR